MSTLITLVEPGMFTAVPAVMTTVSPSATSPCSRAAAESPELATSLAAAHDEQRRVRPELDLGVGGARAGAGGLKCLHAHAAFALARPGYELGERILGEVEPLWPNRCCSE